MSQGKKSIWIDLDNTPHVVFFQPIIKSLQERGYRVDVTIRAFYQIEQLARLKRLSYVRIGRHYGKHKSLKLLGLFVRALEFVPFILSRKPDLAISHGSRTQLVAATLFSIPTIMAFDYEFTQWLPIFRPKMVIAPELLAEQIRRKKVPKVALYPGIKEDVYVPQFQPSPDLLTELSLDPNKVILTIRPPADHAHYHVQKSDELFQYAVRHIASLRNVQTVFLPRTPEQKERLTSDWRSHFTAGSFRILETTVDGLDLIWHSDLVLSGGGTIIREAAALGVPAYSLFGGRIGAVDSFLERSGRLTILHSERDIREKLRLEKREKNFSRPNGNPRALPAIVAAIEDALKRKI